MDTTRTYSLSEQQAALIIEAASEQCAALLNGALSDTLDGIFKRHTDKGITSERSAYYWLNENYENITSFVKLAAVALDLAHQREDIREREELAAKVSSVEAEKPGTITREQAERIVNSLLDDELLDVYSVLSTVNGMRKTGSTAAGR